MIVILNIFDFFAKQATERVHKRKAAVANLNCERAWLAKRRCSIDLHVRSGSSSAAVAKEAEQRSHELWSDQQAMEAQLQQDRQAKNRNLDLNHLHCN